MKISELSPEYRRVPPHAGLITELSRVVADAESFDTSASSPEKLAADFRRILTNLAAASSSLTNACRIQIWKLGTRLWNACVDRANSTALARGAAARAAEAEIRQAAPELLLLVGTPDDIPFAAVKNANFFRWAGEEWLALGRVDLASACFEKATSLVSAAATEEERCVLLELNLARARAASDAGDQALAVALLSRSKPLAASSPERIKSLAEGYLSIGEATVKRKGPSDPVVEASSILAEALDLCEKAASTSAGTPKTPDLDRLKGRCLRFLALERHEAKDHDGVLRCIRVSRASLGLTEEHPSMEFIALQAWLGTGNVAEAEKELERLMANDEAYDNLCVTAAEVYLSSVGPEAARKVLIALAARCRGGAAAAAVRVVRKVVQGGIMNTGRTRVIAELVSDERVVKLFDGPDNTIERGAMHALLWTCGTEHFQAKNYDTSADLFERSMLYVSREEESRSRRANCFRVLTLCHIALQHLDRALEFINEADKVEGGVTCAFLKFKIHMLKKDEDEAIKHMKTMVGSAGFNSQFLTLATHEAIACKSFRVAVASMTFLLGLYTTGKPMPNMSEVVVLRNLIGHLFREPGTEAEILKYSRRAKLRMSELGAEGFFGNGTVGGRELNWFAGNSWNMGIRLASEQKYNLSAEFFELAAEFFGSSNGETDGDQPMVCKALIMCVTAMVNAELLNSSPLSDSDLKKGVEMLSQAGKLLPLIWSLVPVASDQLEAKKLQFLHTFNSYHLLDRIDTSAQPQQLQLVKDFASSKACTPDYLLTLGIMASKGTPPNLLVAEFALKASISSALTSHSPNYRVISIALRNLVCLAGWHDSNDSKSDAVYDIFRQAYQILVGLKDDEYPFEEGKWLATTAWNKSFLSLRLKQKSVARKWMKMGLDLSRHLESMKEYIASMEEYFERTFGNEPDECSQQDGVPSTSISGSMSQPVLV